MSPSPMCGTCRWFEPTPFTDDHNHEGAEHGGPNLCVGTCHRHAPVGHNESWGSDDDPGPGQERIDRWDWQWPRVDAAEWCAEHRPTHAARRGAGIGSLGLSVRAVNCLHSVGVGTVSLLAKMTEADLLRIRNLGSATLAEIKARLREHGLELGMGLQEFPE